MTDQADEFGRRENTPFTCTASWEAAGLKCQALAALHPRPGAAAAAASPPSLREEMVAGGAVLPFVWSWSSKETGLSCLEAPYTAVLFSWVIGAER